MQTLADQLRNELTKPKDNSEKVAASAKKGNTKPKALADPFPILKAIKSYDNSFHKSMVHVRFDEKTVRTMNQFKMATEVDVTRFVAFAVKRLLETAPEIKIIIKQFIQNQEL